MNKEINLLERVCIWLTIIFWITEICITLMEGVALQLPLYWMIGTLKKSRQTKQVAYMINWGPKLCYLTSVALFSTSWTLLITKASNYPNCQQQLHHQLALQLHSSWLASAGMIPTSENNCAHRSRVQTQSPCISIWSTHPRNSKKNCEREIPNTSKGTPTAIRPSMDNSSD